ncbi:MAG: hypothetical protein ACREGL_04240, partial [Alphaproteobacteria bacterium]
MRRRKIVVPLVALASLACSGAALAGAVSAQTDDSVLAFEDMTARVLAIMEGVEIDEAALIDAAPTDEPAVAGGDEADSPPPAAADPDTASPAEPTQVAAVFAAEAELSDAAYDRTRGGLIFSAGV